MNTPLLTSDGFPRDDIDIVQGKQKKKKKRPLGKLSDEYKY